MKKAATVFLIIGMVLTCYMVFPVVIGALAIKHLNKAKTTDELKVWGILSVFFVSTLGGVFMLCVRQSELDNSYHSPVKNSTGYSSDYDPSKKLLQLKELFDEGVIDEETYQAKRKKYVEEL